MSLKGSLSRRFSAWTENANIKNLQTINRSYSFWFYTASNPSAGWQMFTLGWWEQNYPYISGNANKQCHLRLEKINGTSAFLRMTDSSGTIYFTANAGVLATGWHHCVMTVNGTSQISVYIDTVNYVSNVAVPAATHFFSFGKPIKHVASKTDSTRFGNMTNTAVADLCVFNGVLSAGERTTLYAGGAPAYDRTSTSPVATALLLRCPLEDSDIDVVSNTHIFGSQLMMEFSTSSPFSNPSTANILKPTVNAGVASKYIFGPNPKAYVFDFGDSFGSLGQGRLSGALYNILNYTRPVGPFMNWVPSWQSNTGNNGQLQTIASGNGYQVETRTTRTVTGVSWAANVATVTYSGPNLVVGTTIKINSIYYIVKTFTPGTGTGTSQTGAVITFDGANPGAITAQTIAVHCSFPATFLEWFDNTGTSTAVGDFQLTNYQAVYNAANQPASGPLSRYLDWMRTSGAVLRIYHRVASDVNQQVKSIVLTTAKNDGTVPAGLTVTGLDNAADAGKIKLLASVPFTDIRETAGGEAAFQDALFKIKTTGTAGDSQNRYLTIVGYEVVFPNSNESIGWAPFTEASWSYSGLGQTYPGVKMVDPFTMNSIVAAITQANPGRQPVVLMDMDIEVKTAAQWLATYTANKAVIDAAFSAAGSVPPKYLIYGMYFHEQAGADNATIRGNAIEQNLGAMQFAQAFPNQVEFVSIYQISDGIYLPSFESSVLAPAPSNAPDGQSYGFEDGRVSPVPFNITDASWNNGTLTLTKTNGFVNFPYSPTCTRALTYVYLEPTSSTGTAVIAGWYQVASMTVSTLTLTATCTGGAAGIGSDIRVVAMWTPLFSATHLSGFGPSVVSDWILRGLMNGITTNSKTLRLVGDRL